MKNSRLENLDNHKTKEQLIAELEVSRSTIAMLSAASNEAHISNGHTAVDQEEVLVAARKRWTEAERVGRIKDEFLGNLFHELRTPITAILVWSRLLKPGTSSPDALVKGLDAIQRSAQIQARLIDDLLDMSRIISGKLRLDVQWVELPAIVDAALESVSSTASEKNIQIEKVLDPFVGPVLGDPDRLQQIVLNLLINAVKFTPNGGKVQITLNHVNSHAELSVSDDGQGISAEFLPHVFERLSQEESSAKKMQTGLGLGLSIVKSLVELHDGSVRVKSDGVDKGATFTITLPISAVHASAHNCGQAHPRTLSWAKQD
jgi:signal transduction histidine kinase